MSAPAPPQGGWPDLAGRIDGRRHVLPVRVYFEDTDFSGLVYHATYVRWCERGRSDYLRLLGIRHADLIDPAVQGEPAAFVVRRLSLEYLKPAHIDEELEVETVCEEVTAATLDLRQGVRRGGLLLCEARVLIVLVGRSGRPQRIPEPVRNAFAIAP